MRIVRVSVIVLAAATLFLFTLVPSRAQSADFGSWAGKWFKVSVTPAAYCLEEGDLYKDSAKFTAYLKSWNWDSGQKILFADLYVYHENRDEWQVIPFNLNYFSGTPLDFLFKFETEQDNFILGGMGQITGKEKSGALASGKINIPAGFQRDYSNDPLDHFYCAGGFKATAGLTATVPVPPVVVVH
jgi:hypothetical protein